MDVNGSFDDEDYEVLMEKVDPNLEPTDDQMMEYANFLGFEFPQDEDLLWLVREGLKEAFPVEWKILRRRNPPTQTVLYFNSETGERSEDDPRDIKYRKLYAMHKARKLLEGRGTTIEHEIEPGLNGARAFEHSREPELVEDDGIRIAHSPQKNGMYSSSASQYASNHRQQADDDGDEDSREVKAVSPMLEATLNSSGSFRRPDLRGATSSGSSSSKEESKGTTASDDVPVVPTSMGGDGAASSSLGQKRNGPGLGMRGTRARASLSEDDAEIFEDDETFRDSLRRTSSMKELERVNSLNPVRKPDNLAQLVTSGTALSLGSFAGSGGGGSSAVPSTAPSTAPTAGVTTANPSSSSSSSKESRESRHRESIKRIEAEITVLREDIVETRKYADSAAARAQQAHADLLKAEARARHAEEEQARLKNELDAFKMDADRRRQSLKDELDSTLKRLLDAEDARDAAERRTREVLLQESTRVKHVERELEALRAKFTRVLRERERTNPAIDVPMVSRAQSRPVQPNFDDDVPVVEIGRSMRRPSRGEYAEVESGPRRAYPTAPAKERKDDDLLLRTTVRGLPLRGTYDLADEYLSNSTRGFSANDVGGSTSASAAAAAARVSRKTGAAHLPSSVASSGRRKEW